MNLEERRRGLLDLITGFRDQECRRILESARQQARALRSQAYRKHRGYLHARIQAERRRAQEKIHAARAQRATRERQEEERRDLALLASAWPLLRNRLLEQWRLPEPRCRWAATYLRRALDLLPHGSWTIRHAPEWTEPERRDAARELAETLKSAPSFAADSGIEAGLIVASKGAMLDASLDGLLLDRARLEARLLALLAANQRP